MWHVRVHVPLAHAGTVSCQIFERNNESPIPCRWLGGEEGVVNSRSTCSWFRFRAAIRHQLTLHLVRPLLTGSDLQFARPIRDACSASMPFHPKLMITCLKWGPDRPGSGRVGANLRLQTTPRWTDSTHAAPSAMVSLTTSLTRAVPFKWQSFRERPYAPDHLVRPLAASTIHSRSGAQARDRNPGRASLDRPSDWCDRGEGCHFMGDRGRQFAQRCYSVRVRSST